MEVCVNPRLRRVRVFVVVVGTKDSKQDKPTRHTYLALPTANDSHDLPVLDIGQNHVRAIHGHHQLVLPPGLRLDLP